MNFEGQEKKKYPFQTATIDGGVYNIDQLIKYAEAIEPQEIATEKLQDFVAEGMVYWEDRKGNGLSPFELLNDWDTAKKREEWQDHVKGVEKADLSQPILATKSGYVFDGMHRLTKAFLEGKDSILVRVVEEIPDDFKVE